MNNIKSAQFVKSSSKLSDCPDSPLPEYAFIGRSNVGKSSLINMLVDRNNLALTGSKPGKTVLINHFLINDKWHLVDLPGYGYAQRGKAQREAFRKLIYGYILGRPQLVNLFILIDCRHEAQKIDLEFIQDMGEAGVPFSLVFTKIDKISKLRLDENIEAYKSVLRESWEELPPIFTVSSVKRKGREELLDYIHHINESL